MTIDCLRSKRKTLFNRPRLNLTKEAEQTFRHIPSIQLSQLKVAMVGLPEGTPDMLEAFKKGDYSHPIFQEVNWVLYAMREHAFGHLTRGEYSRLMLYDDCSSEKGFEVLTGYYGLEPYIEELFESFQGDISREKFDEFIHSLDAGDQIFKISPPPAEGKQGIPEYLTTEISATQFYSKGSYFILPPDVLEKFFTICTPHPMKPNPVNGYSTPEKFESTEQRDVYIPNRYVPYPNELHHFPIKKAWEIYWHDANYHLYIESANPHRNYWTEMGLFFKEKDRSLYNVTIDRELVFYSPRQQKRIFPEGLSQEESFWLNIPLYLSLLEREVTSIDSTRAALKSYFSTKLPEGVSEKGLSKVCNLFANTTGAQEYPHHDFLFEMEKTLNPRAELHFCENTHQTN